VLADGRTGPAPAEQCDASAGVVASGPRCGGPFRNTALRGATMTAAADVVAGLRLLAQLPRLMRTRIAHVDAEAALRTRLERREADFLALVRQGVYENPASPWRRLLAHAGCEPDDLARLVRADGVEGALRTLLRAGVYLTVDELKGRCPIVRGSLTCLASPASFRNPRARPDVLTTSGGSRGRRTRVHQDLAFMWEGLTSLQLTLEARGGLGWRFAVWGVPGGVTFQQLVALATIGQEPPQFFSRLDAQTERTLLRRYRWSWRLLKMVGRLAGRPFPRPLHAPLGNPAPLIRWFDTVRAQGGTPHVQVYASTGVRLAEAAARLGTDLRGVQFSLSGEPLTAARRAAIERSGGVALPRMGNTEMGTVVASGCLAPEGCDDMHLLHDMQAVIQPGDEGIPGLTPRTLLASSIRPRAPLVLLNTSLGDVGTLSDRRCGCPMADLGWTTHLMEVRSHEKLTAGGMTIDDADLIRVLEEVLPRRFGGGPLDYQLVEEETVAGDPVVRLRVHPAIGPLAAEAVVGAFLDAIGPGRGFGRVVTETWREAGFVRVEREPPLVTPGGKVQHRHSAGRRPVLSDA
jgi:hypothetical protein